MNYDKLTDIRFEDVDHDDYPDYCDAYVSSAKYEGVELTEDELDALNDSDFVSEYLLKLRG